MAIREEVRLNPGKSCELDCPQSRRAGVSLRGAPALLYATYLPRPGVTAPTFCSSISLGSVNYDKEALEMRSGTLEKEVMELWRG